MKCNQVVFWVVFGTFLVHLFAVAGRLVLGRHCLANRGPLQEVPSKVQRGPGFEVFGLRLVRLRIFGPLLEILGFRLVRLQGFGPSAG